MGATILEFECEIVKKHLTSSPLLPFLCWDVVVAHKPSVYGGGEKGVRAIADHLLPSAVCMLISLSLQDKPTARQCVDSAAEQCPIIPAPGARGWPPAHGLWPNCSSNSFGWASNTAWGFDMCQQFQMSCFCELPTTQLSETLGRAPCVPWAVPSTPCSMPRQYWWLKESMDVHV